MTNYYPGMPYASYITIYEHDRTGGGYTGWAEAINDPPTLTQSVTLALAQGAEGVGFPEWGIRNDAYGPSVIPDPAYINSAFSWMQGVTEQGLNVLASSWRRVSPGSISGIVRKLLEFRRLSDDVERFDKQRRGGHLRVAGSRLLTQSNPA